MIRGTTPTFTLTVIGAEFDTSTIYVTLSQANRKILTKTGEDLSVSTEDNKTIIDVYLTQQETLSFKPGIAQIQIRWIDELGTACATPIKSIDISDVLLDGVIEYV